MRDYKTYKPTEEAIKALKEKYKSYNNAWSEYRTNLLIMCMMPQENRNNFDFSQTLMGLRFNLMGLADEIRYKARESAFNEFKNEGKITFGCYGYSDNTQEEIEERAKKELALLAVAVNTPDYFESGSNFYDKRTAIEENIDLFVEEMEEIANHELMEYFKDYIVKEEEDEDDDI